MTRRVLQIDTADGHTFYSADWSYLLVAAREVTRHRPADGGMPSRQPRHRSWLSRRSVDG